MSVQLSSKPEPDNLRSRFANQSTTETNKGSETNSQKDSTTAPEKSGTTHSNNDPGNTEGKGELTVKDKEDSNTSTVTKRKREGSMAEGEDGSQACKRSKRHEAVLQTFLEAVRDVVGVQPQGLTAEPMQLDFSSGRDCDEQMTSDTGGGEVLKEHVNVVKTHTPLAQDAVDRQDVESSRASGFALEQPRSVPMPLTSQISTLSESSSVSNVSSGRVTQLASIPSSRPNSQPALAVSSLPGSRAATPNSTGTQQQAASFAATYRSPFVNPSCFSQPVYGPPHAPMQQNFLPQHVQTPQWGNQHSQPVLPCIPASQTVFPTFSGPSSMLNVGEVYLPPPSFFQRPAPAPPITSNFPTTINPHPVNPPQANGVQMPKSRGTSVSTSVSPALPHSSNPKAPTPLKRSPSAAIENGTEKVLALISSTTQQRIAEEHARFAVERQAWHANSMQLTREIDHLRQRIAQLEQVTAPPIAGDPTPTVEVAPAAAGGGGHAAEAEVKRLEQEVTRLQERIVQLTTHVSRLKSAGIEKMALEATVRTLQAANLDQDAQLAKYRARRLDNAEKMLRNKARADTAMRELEAKDARIAELERALEAVQTHGQVARAEFEVSSARLVGVQGDVLDAHARILKLEEIAAQRAVYIDDLEYSCAQVAEALMGLEIEQHTQARIGSPPQRSELPSD